MIRILPPPCQRWTILLLALLIVLPALAATPRQTVEGRWRLVEQYRGSGGANLLEGGQALHLEFGRAETGLRARVWSGEDPSKVVPWLSAVGECGPLPVTIDEIAFLKGERGVRARYRIAPPGQDGIEYEVVEQYAVTEGGGALAGTVHVTALKEGEEEGSYVLRRRFERVP